MAHVFENIRHTIARLLRVDRQLDDIKINQGRILAELLRRKRLDRLADYEFKVFSQWGEDGIIQFLTANIVIKNRTFIEFGVEDFFESNCRLLLMKDNWRGFVIDGSDKNIRRLRSSYFYWRHSLEGKSAFVTRENINGILEESGFDRELGLLSIDIDGVDYHVLEKLEGWNPAVVIVEYNAIFGAKDAVTVPYDPTFQRAKKHHSNLYYGASLSAFCCLMDARDYGFVGVNGAGSNAFFVRRDLLNEAVREIPVPCDLPEAQFREARDTRGNLTFAMGHTRREVIANMPLIDVRSGQTIRVQNLRD